MPLACRRNIYLCRAPNIECSFDCVAIVPLTVKDSGPKSATNSDSIWVGRLFNVCVRVFCAPNATILLIYLSTKIKMNFIWKDDFLAKIGIFCKSIDRRSTSQHCSSRYTTIFVRRKDTIIICQIRHKLSVSEISTSWKKKR